MSVPLSATHQGVDGPAVRPHALTRFGSVKSVLPGRSETSRSTVYALPAAATGPAKARRKTKPIATAGMNLRISEPPMEPSVGGSRRPARAECVREALRVARTHRFRFDYSRNGSARI